MAMAFVLFSSAPQTTKLTNPFVADFTVPKFSGALHSTVTAATVEKEDIQDHLRRTLPEFMIPSRMVLLEDLPPNASDKLDGSLMPPPPFLGRFSLSSIRRSYAEPM